MLRQGFRLGKAVQIAANDALGISGQVKVGCLVSGEMLPRAWLNMPKIS